MGYDIVRVLISGKERRVLQIMAERQSDGGMSVEDCTRVSREVSALLDVEVPINETVPVNVDVPVKLDVPIEVNIAETDLKVLADQLAEALRNVQAVLGDLTG